jgi:hypothetical protein
LIQGANLLLDQKRFSILKDFLTHTSFLLSDGIGVKKPVETASIVGIFGRCLRLMHASRPTAMSRPSRTSWSPALCADFRLRGRGNRYAPILQELIQALVRQTGPVLQYRDHAPGSFIVFRSQCFIGERSRKNLSAGSTAELVWLPDRGLQARPSDQAEGLAQVGQAVKLSAATVRTDLGFKLVGNVLQCRHQGVTDGPILGGEDRARLNAESKGLKFLER